MRLNGTLNWHSPEGLVRSVAAKVGQGARFCALFASPEAAGTRLLALLSHSGTLVPEATMVPEGAGGFPTLTAATPAAAWYERRVKDLFGLEPRGHPRPDPLVLPRRPGSAPPRPGWGQPVSALPPDDPGAAPPAACPGQATGPLELDLSPLPAHVQGEGVFTLPYGPVRSGVVESVEYLIETPGERVPHVRARTFYKHRGMQARFPGLSLADGALLAERYEGVASVAHAIAYCSALESIAGCQPPPAAGLVRVLHAELERVANHLSSLLAHTEAAAQAVAAARVATHKERLQRLRAELCGNRFGRGVVVPGGVSGPPLAGAKSLLGPLTRLQAGIRADLELLMATPSFVDRLRRTGVIAPSLARERAALGPVGRASGQAGDLRSDHPYAAYASLRPPASPTRTAGDALARQQVRQEEMESAFDLARQALEGLEELGPTPVGGWRAGLGAVTGEALGWAEAPQGELFYLVDAVQGRVRQAQARSASFHNLALFATAFPDDIFTDFAFIEASFGVSIAGVAG